MNYKQCVSCADYINTLSIIQKMFLERRVMKSNQKKQGLGERSYNKRVVWGYKK